MDNPEKLATYSTQDGGKQNKNTTQYTPHTTTHKQTQTTQTRRDHSYKQEEAREANFWFFNSFPLMLSLFGCMRCRSIFFLTPSVVILMSLFTGWELLCLSGISVLFSDLNTDWHGVFTLVFFFIFYLNRGPILFSVVLWQYSHFLDFHEWKHFFYIFFILFGLLIEIIYL